MKNTWFLTALFFSATLIGQIPTTGLIGHWPFSGNANDAVGGNNGNVFNATLTADRFGNPGCAYNFNGTNSYIIMANAGPTGTVSRSVSFWAKTTNPNLMTAFCYGSSPGSFALQLNYGCPGIGFDIGNAAYTRKDSVVTDGTWHHYAAVFDASVSTQITSLNFYVDGTLQSAMPLACIINSVGTVNSFSTFPINIGKVSDNNFRHFNGDLDDFYLYNRALTPTEVMALYNEAQCTGVTAAPSAITGSVQICPGSTTIYSVSPVSGASSYSWSLPGGWTGSSTSNTISVIAGTSSGPITVSAKNCCGYSQPSVLSVATSCAGITEIALAEKNNIILPNPNNGSFSIERGSIETRCKLEIYSLTGQMVYNRDLEKGDEIINTGLGEGSYVLVLKEGENPKTVSKLIVSGK